MVTTNSWCFCDRKGIEDRIISENDDFYRIVDDAPVSPGHILIVPKKHIVNLTDLDPILWGKLRNEITEAVNLFETTDFKSTYQKLLDSNVNNEIQWFLNKAIDSPYINTKPDAFNYGVNEGRAAGRTVDHLHWHIIPRYDGDVVDPRGGVRYVIPEMGNYKIPR